MIFRALMLFFCCGLLADTVCASESVLVSVKIGIENTYKNGLWTPISVKSNASIDALAIRCSDADGIPITYHYKADGQEKMTVLAKLGRKDEPIQISLNDAAFQSFTVPSPVNAEKPIYLIFGNEDIGLQGAVAELALRTDRRPTLVTVNSVADLPEQWFGYESIEMIVLTTTAPQLFEGLTKDSPQVKAMNDWLNLGGKMLLCAGKDSGQFLEPENGFLRLFLPGQFTEMTEMRSGTPFELFVNSKRQIFMNGTDEAPFMKMPRFTNPRGIIFVKDGDLPLVLRAAHGLGTLIYFGGDLSEKPIGNWRDRSVLVRNVMQWNTEKRTVVDPRSGAMLQLGYNDITGQIRSALDKFENVRIVQFSVILIILTAYWLFIGLFDWFFVHKVLKRPILTWITFPLWIVLFSILTYTLAAPGRPADGISNILTVHDFDIENQRHRISTWFSEYSPTDSLFDYENQTPVGITNGYVSWNGLPGSGLGGMAPKTVSPTIWKIGSEQKSYNELVNVPIQTRSSKSFFGQHSGTISKEYEITAQLADEDGVPIGTIYVSDDFVFHMDNCMLIYGRWVLDLGEIKSGKMLNITKTTTRRELRELLIPLKTLENLNLRVPGPRGLATYNSQSDELPYIVRVMSVYKLLGGYASTGLHHTYQPTMDWSDLLTTDRALLLGTVRDKEHVPKERKSDYVTSVFRYSFPIKLTALSPRLNMHREEFLPDKLDQKITPGLIQDSLIDGKPNPQRE